MPIITLTQVKTLLQLTTTDSARDTLISTLIPVVQKRVTEYCNNRFLVLSDQLQAGTIAFVSGAPATITDSDSGFVDAGLSDGCDICIGGSKRNNGIYQTATVVAGLITLATGEVLRDEDAENIVSVTRVSWPIDISFAVAILISYYVEKTGKLVDTENLPGGYSVKYKTDAEVMTLFNQWRKPYK